MIKIGHVIWLVVLTAILSYYMMFDFGQAADISQNKKNIYSFLTPIVISLLVFELLYCFVFRKTYFTFQESIANFCTAMGNQSTNLLVMVSVYFTYGYLWNNFHWLEIDMSHWWNWILLLIGVDFIFYWVHRWGHEVNILWAAHSPHHSAEEMNLMVGLRASITQRLMSFLFFWPLTIIGFQPEYIYAMTGIHLVLGYWHHTEVLPKFWSWIEYIFNTPSHHRVHHGVNFQYLDKNYAEFLILWDRIFGTFEEEDEKVVYGMYNGPASWNPIKINFHYYIILWNKAKATPYLWDKFYIWFAPLTWQPRGLPAYEANDEITLENQVRYQSESFAQSRLYIIIHMLLCLGLMMFIINAGSTWSTTERWIGAALLWHTIINLSGILEAKSWLLVSEIMRLFFLAAIMILFNDWQTQLLPMSIIAGIAIVSSIWTYNHFQPNSPTEKAEQKMAVA